MELKFSKEKQTKRVRIKKPKVKKSRYQDKTLKQLIKIADDNFSEYIRYRDTSKGTIGRCICCGKPLEYKINATCGHFVHRDRHNLRYDEINCGGQTHHCNTYLSGNEAGFAQGLDRKYGAGTAQRLIDTGDRKYQLSRSELIAVIVKYQLKLKQLKGKL